MYAITEASSGYRASHSSASSRVAPHFTPRVLSPRKAKIFAPTLATWSSSQGWSAHAPGLPRAYSRSSPPSTPRSSSGVARRSTLPAEDDDEQVVVRRLGDRGVARRVQPPFQHRAVDHDRPGHVPLGGPLPLRA